MFSSLKLNTKLISSFSIVALLTLLVGTVGMYGITILNRNLTSLSQDNLPSVKNLLTIKGNVAAISRIQRTLLSPEIDLARRERQYALVAQESTQKQKVIEEYESLPKQPEETGSWREVTGILQEYDKIGEALISKSKDLDKTGILNPASMIQKLDAFRGDHYLLMNKTLELIVNKAMFDGGEDAAACAFGKWKAALKVENPIIQKALQDITQAHEAFHHSVKTVKELIKQEKTDEAFSAYKTRMAADAESVFKGFEVLRQESVKAGELYLGMNQMAMNELAQKMNDAGGRLDKILQTTLGKAAASQKQAASGSRLAQILSISGTAAGFTSALIFGILLSLSISRLLNRITSGLDEGSAQVASAATEVSSASQSLAEGASQQAASIEETSSSLEEMSSMTRQNASNAGQADSLMKQTNQVVIKANTSMNQLTTSMREITTASEETSKIIKTIDEIALQTNLLALNAAVEAARAGEAGAGFAVVADEVRNLAMRAAEAAKNTAILIEGTVKKVTDGSALVKTTNDAFKEVASNAAKVGELVGEIAAASSEQAQGIEQVNIAVTEMDKVTQQNAANAEESASASEELNAQAEELKAFVNELAAMVGGASKASAGRSRAVRCPGIAGHNKTAQENAMIVAKKLPKKKILSLHRSEEINPDDIIPMDDSDLKDF
ncbi:MAG: MCP four helix bundle domain-containing protein [Deltaproteobacteria bacterium]|nr:MCP four helix bundle domain-containing protein [Deltaproteobacteria bacterium]